MKALNTQKITAKGRVSYSYEFVTGEKFTIHTDEAGVTLADIQGICRIHNNEVESNLKYLHNPISKKELEEIQQWNKEHPKEKNYGNWILSMDSFTDDNGNSTADRHAELSYMDKPFSDDIPELERLHEIIESLPERQRMAYRLVYQNEYQEKVAAEMMGITPAAITKLLNKVREKISADETLKNIFKGG